MAGGTAELACLDALVPGEDAENASGVEVPKHNFPVLASSCAQEMMDAGLSEVDTAGSCQSNRHTLTNMSPFLKLEQFCLRRVLAGQLHSIDTRARCCAECGAARRSACIAGEA